MISVEHVTMDYKVQKENIHSLKEYLLNFIRGRITYSRFRALDDVSLEIKKGEVCGIVGANGAGKSTLLKIIAGVLTPTEGKVKIDGAIAPMLELGAGFDIELTARENVYLNGAILGYSKEFLDSKYDEIVDFSELSDFMSQPIRTFSSGMHMRLAFSIATVVEPEILIVDEILGVGDAHFQHKSEDRMRQLMSGGTTVLMVSHTLSLIKGLCERAVWLEKGKIKADGPAKEICEAYESNAGV